MPRSPLAILLAVPLATTLALAAPPAGAARLDGVTMPDTLAAEGGAPLVLNGMAVRTYSLLHIHVYVAGLYLERRSADAAAILDSPDTKVLRFVFSRDVDAEAARKSWRESLAESCSGTCRLDPALTARFLASVPAVREGDTSAFHFARQGLTVTFNGRSLGTITDPVFVRTVLATFIGPHPTQDAVRRGLLGAAR